MGMFDRIFLKCVCPYCGDDSKREIQTKELHNFLHRYQEGDEVDTDKEWITGTAICRSEACELSARARDAQTQGTYSGFGMPWDVSLKVELRRIMGFVKITDIRKFISMIWIHNTEYPEKIYELLRSALKEYSEYSTMMWRKE